MREKYAHNRSWTQLPRDQVINAHINAYRTLFEHGPPCWGSFLLNLLDIVKLYRNQEYKSSNLQALVSFSF